MTRARPRSAPKVDLRRGVPSLDALLRTVPARKGAEKFGRSLVKHALQKTLEEMRADAARGRAGPEIDAILARALGAAARDYYGISEVLNATGVLLHTGLGRAPLPPRAADAAASAARGYSDLEIDREGGGRGRRTSRAEAVIEALTGAEAALVVNNNAGALLLAIAALAGRKEVLVSRGELIEIGGEFRLPDILAASGAKLVEVGTTNRTRTADYRKAIGPKTGLVLKVHPSNYRVVGFTDSAPASDLSGVAARAGIPVLYDVGSGLLDRFPEVPADEPSVAEALGSGADVVTFSGDKLLGGPQSGIAVGRGQPIERMRKHPLARALRVDKMTVAALEAVLRMYATGRRLDLPLWRALATPPAALLRRATALASAFQGATAEPGEAAVGGGSLPGHVLPSAQLVLPTEAPEELARRLRLGRPPVLCRTGKDVLAFDLRSVPPEDDDRLARAIRYALEQR